MERDEGGSSSKGKEIQTRGSDSSLTSSEEDTPVHTQIAFPKKISNQEESWLRRNSEPLQDQPVIVGGRVASSTAQYIRPVTSGSETLTGWEAAKVLFPNHVPGEGNGWGHFGANNTDFAEVLKNNTDKKTIEHYFENISIPPEKGLFQMHARSDIWYFFVEKHRWAHLGHRDENSNLLHDLPKNISNYKLNDTYITLLTNLNTKEEKRSECISIMNRSKELILFDKDNRPNGESSVLYWRYLHEFMAMRHYYQVYLLDDNT